MNVRRPVTLLLLALVTACVFLALVTRRPAEPLPVPTSSFAFATLGDAPYYPWEDIKYRVVLKDLNAQDLAFVIHVGDIIWHPCSDDLYRRALNRFDHLNHPVIYTPGDNEWTDCWEEGSGSFHPLDRLQRLREIFFTPPGRSIGGTPIPLESQGQDTSYTEFVENTRWMSHGFLFVCVNLPGSRNARDPFPQRTKLDDDAADRRTLAGAAWLEDTFAEAEARGAVGVILSFHGDPGLAALADDAYRQAYDPFLEVLENESAAFGKPVLVIHGDEHEYRVDHPLTQRSTGRHLDNVTRLEVPGSPRVGWVRVIVTPGSKDLFRFEEHVLGTLQYF